MQARTHVSLTKCQEAWESPTADLWIKLYGGLELHKAGILKASELEPLAVELAKQSTKISEEYAILAIVGDLLGKTFLAKPACLSLLQQMPHTCIPPYLRDDFFSALTSPHYWTKKSVAKDNDYQAKINLLASIKNIKDPRLRQNALWQCLCPETSLGAFFASGSKIFDATSSWTQHLIQILATELNSHKVLLWAGTEIAVGKNEELLKKLAEEYRDVYAKLVQFGLIKKVSGISMYQPQETEETPQTLERDRQIGLHS